MSSVTGNFLNDCCSLTCDLMCKSVCKDMPPCVAASLLLAISITMLVVGILGASSVIYMEPTVAYFGCILPSMMMFILSCLSCCKK